MLYNALKLLHVLSIIVWVGGMAFAHFFLRPAVQQLAPAERVPLMRAILQRFLAAVGASVVVVLTTGLALIGMVSMGGGFVMPWDWKFMSGVGLLMMAIYAYIYLALLSRLDTAVQAADWAVGGDALARIRTWVGINLLLGTAIVVVVLLW
ncbi:CopD family protein [Melaminivora alkalimesophila]|uniref:Putative membrane protein n=1 Tax=Melaminivora alkalimesophila TaxID=1165852 RepID=A0A317R9V0_9BURK|nr:CopD family protein [Melaminivora alkalimesophila]PWW45841.1 putative membrane protein [Melaminivora alkalimesophila]